MVRVAPDLRRLGKTFDYLLPAGTAPAAVGAGTGAQVEVGTEVRVPLNGRVVRGWVVALDTDPPPGVRPSPIVALRSIGPPPSVVALAEWAAWRWAGPRSLFLGTASSDTVVRALPPAPPATCGPPALSAPLAPPGPAAPGVAFDRAQQWVRPCGDVAGGDAPGWEGQEAGAGWELANEALGGGVSVVRLPPAEDGFAIVLAAASLVPIAAPQPQGRGVAAGVLVLVPGRAAAAALASRLERAGIRPALMPGGWARARAGGCVVVGTRSAAFAPLPEVAAVVVLDAHDEAYEEESAPTWCAWRVAVERARRDRAPCALLSPVPTLEILSSGRLVAPSRSVERSGWPPLQVVDRRGADPRTGMFSEPVVELVRWAVEPGTARRVACVLDRTGRARVVACGACGEVARCERCGVALRVEAPNAERLSCRRCATEQPMACPRCGSTRLKNLRPGVSRVREELEALAGAPVAEMWGPGTRPGRELLAPGERRGDVAGAPGDRAGLASGWAGAVVGTEAVLHRLDWADYVVFLDFDAYLDVPRYAAFEDALALVARAARLVSRSRSVGGGTARAPGRVLLQTCQPRHDVVVAAARADPAHLGAAEKPVREALRLPPFGCLARVSGPAAPAYAAALESALASGAHPGASLDAASGGAWWLRAPSANVLAAILSSCERPPGRLRVEVEPRHA